MEWVFSNSGLLIHLGPTPTSRVAVVADLTGTPRATLAMYISGETVIPAEWALAFMERFLPGLNPVVLQHTVGVAAPDDIEHDALRHWQAVELPKLSTFADAIASLKDASDTFEVWAEEEEEIDLDDGRPVPEPIKARLREFLDS
jgi:hypothetical protein